MKKWLFRLIWLPALALAVLFLIANRQPVAISLDPFNADAPALTTYAFPLWAWLMVMLFIGLAAGSIGMWLSARPRRTAARADRRAVKDLRKEVTRLETALAEARKDHRPPEEGGDKAPGEPAPLLRSENV